MKVSMSPKGKYKPFESVPLKNRTWPDKIIEKAQLDTMYENEEDEDEYNVILMRDLNNNSLFEISYKNIPLEIISNGENIIKQ